MPPRLCVARRRASCRLAVLARGRPLHANAHLLPILPILLPGVVFVAWMLGACTSTPHSVSTLPPIGKEERPRTVATGRGEFAVPASTIDTWNAVGQILVRLEGVTYEGRAQMLGLYAVRYRGEGLLILTRGLVVTADRKTIATEVRAAHIDGKPTDSEAALELLRTLQRLLPAEIERIAAKGR